MIRYMYLLVIVTVRGHWLSTVWCTRPDHKDNQYFGLSYVSIARTHRDTQTHAIASIKDAWSLKLMSNVVSCDGNDFDNTNSNPTSLQAFCDPEDSSAAWRS